ncbi:MAG: DUF4387 domain-containing protein [Alphaproteobacteria bacterium]|uniref:DUF4387 domain-containing protein n=1 Tax=Brevundimonas sp. TaxID=1871086 RepID=UPI001A18C7FE|nr:DUF4387 domain-containing protein [Brevundimonas sp.]MBU1271577.1 DUF4387 domain-containing protein [Alphaproteobacteria bacterium]MBJ7318781.1 DUF4387 domain-containing protein [Brevundimonas sp.]MBU1520319.1 DUF4387 domain-containing protein [Alphaproteobacteria bacterium]MBU2030812.1 DUF4387 domain-containing protein [Alphaproteobacteria bacterium]MBU2163504.1 DUF4387 domain-containing protein [Alphaproteobacteria bacterium]
MTRLKEACSHLRSKNAGPFWITVDLFFDGPASFAAWKDRPGLSTEALAAVFGVDPSRTKRIEAPDLSVIKFSYPRANPQGGVGERDMHSGQQYVLLLDHEI